MKPILNIENLTKIYGNVPSQTKALNGITFQVMPGEFLGIMGSSGSGKSTLLNCIATVIQPTGGSIQVEGVNLQALKGRALADYRGKKVGYLFQNFELLDNLTGRENILLPTSLHGIPEKESSQRLSQLAKYLEINDVLDKFPSKMSGGQRQRVAAARALILNPRMILADEPTGALDSKNARNIMEKLSGLNRDEQATILMVTHDSNAASFCKRILFIQDGVIFHELRRGDESRQEFYGRILKVMAQLGGGSSNVLSSGFSKQPPQPKGKRSVFQFLGDFYYCLLYDSFHLYSGCYDLFAEDGERCREQALASDSCVLRNDPGYSFLFDLLRLQVSV